MQHQPRRRFAQNFLHERRVIERMAAAIAPRRGQAIVEIGPGAGALTEPLLAGGASVHALELDRDLAAELPATLGFPATLRVEQCDALRADFLDLMPEAAMLRVVGNLPYNVSTPLLFHVLAASARIDDMHFLLQREVVARMGATPGSREYGRLSVMTQWHCHVEPLFDVGPGAFRPAPRVGSTFVRLLPRAAPPACCDAQALAEVVSRAFGQRRKTLRNSLRGLLDGDAIAAAGVDPGTRAEALGLTEFAGLARALSDAAPAPRR